MLGRQMYFLLEKRVASVKTCTVKIHLSYIEMGFRRIKQSSSALRVEGGARSLVEDRLFEQNLGVTRVGLQALFILGQSPGVQQTQEMKGHDYWHCLLEKGKY